MIDYRTHYFGDGCPDHEKPRVIAVQKAEGVPGLYDVTFEDGSTKDDMTTGQVTSLIDQHGVMLV